MVEHVPSHATVCAICNTAYKMDIKVKKRILFVHVLFLLLGISLGVLLLCLNYNVIYFFVYMMYTLLVFIRLPQHVFERRLKNADEQQSSV